MAYSAEVREKAFKIYRKNKSVVITANEIGIHHATIENWREKYKWKDKISKIREKVHEIEKEKAVKEELKCIEVKKEMIVEYAKEDSKNLEVIDSLKTICIESIEKYKLNRAIDIEILSVMDLRSITNVMTELVKLERLIKGDPTEITQHNVTTHDNYLAICQKIDVEINLLKGGDDETE